MTKQKILNNFKKSLQDMKQDEFISFLESAGIKVISVGEKGTGSFTILNNNLRINVLRNEFNEDGIVNWDKVVSRKLGDIYSNYPTIGYNDTRLDEFDNDILETLKFSLDDEE